MYIIQIYRYNKAICVALETYEEEQEEEERLRRGSKEWGERGIYIYMVCVYGEREVERERERERSKVGEEVNWGRHNKKRGV